MYKIKNMKLKDQNSKEVEAVIKPIQKEKMPLKKNGWNFNWRELAKSKNKRFYALLVDNKVEGMISLEIQKMGVDKLLFLHHLEIAPHNIGRFGKYKQSAGCLLAYACYQSILEIENGTPYAGFVVFESKTELIEHYVSYGAQYAMGNKMFFDPKAGDALIKKYLK